jgi:ABC-type transporter Mla subunit MlaD
MRRSAITFGAVFLVAASVAGYWRFGAWNHRLELKTYFQDAQGLRANAPVRLAGVDVGKVVSVRVKPEISQSPAEVVMSISTPYELKIPSDSTVSLATAGVLGETFAQIEIQGASGAPATSGTVLKSRHTEVMGPKEFVDMFAKEIKPCDEKADMTAGSGENDADHKGH